LGLGGTTAAERVKYSLIDWLRTKLDDQEITGLDSFLEIGGHSLTSCE